MKKLVAAAACLLLAGCAIAPKPNIAPKHSHAKRVSVSTPAAKSAGTTFKERWSDRFKTHPKWFR